MERRYQIFVSSTYEDLKEARSKVITAILSMGHIPCGMEYFPASDEDAWHCIERLIPQCDYYVLLLAGKYGSVPEGESKSFTQKEYEHAVASDVPVLSLLHANPDNLPKKLCESNPEDQKRLDRFRTLAKKRLCRFWKTSDQIPGELLASLSHQIDRIPRTGWVRADSVSSEEAKNEIITLGKKLEKTTQDLRRLKKERQEREEALASGDDPIKLTGKLQSYRSAFSLRRHHRNSEEETRTEFETTFEALPSWNDLIRVIADRKVLEFSTRDLEGWITSWIEDSAKNRSSLAELKGWEEANATLPMDTSDVIVTQLAALGLISRRKSYPEWSLTQKGILLGSRQRALKKGEVEPTIAGWCEVRIGEIEEVDVKSVQIEDWT